MPGLEGRIVVITGASSGIGRETAIAVAASGASVVLAARRKTRLEEVANQILGAGGSALPVVSDVGEEESVDQLFSQTSKVFGPPDILINNAGVGLYSTVEETTAGQMERLWKINFLGTFYCIRRALPLMRERGSGHIITVSSMAGRRGTPFGGGYCASKFAQVGLMDSLRRELENSGIYCTVVYPGPTETEFLQSIENPRGLEIRHHGSVRTAAQVAQAIVHAIHYPSAEIITQKFGRVLLVMNAISPVFVDRLVSKTVRRK